jgi:hypothetical protein
MNKSMIKRLFKFRIAIVYVIVYQLYINCISIIYLKYSLCIHDYQPNNQNKMQVYTTDLTDKEDL